MCVEVHECERYLTCKNMMLNQYKNKQTNKQYPTLKAVVHDKQCVLLYYGEHTKVCMHI